MYIRNIKEVKINLRAKYRQFRERLSSEKKSTLDSAILERLGRLREYAEANTVFTYVSKSIEVDTVSVINKALSDGKKVAVPRCLPETHGMEFYEIQSWNQLESGYCGVLEPDPKKCAPVKGTKDSVCIVPGLSFDSLGYRLGYGKGYYDRFLPGYKGVTIGLCYSGCIQWNLPHGYYDQPVDVLITEKYVRRTGKQP